MKKNFSINLAAKKVQILSAKLESSNILNIVEKGRTVCCDFLVASALDPSNVQKSLILR